mgnify:CR=1 FL=1
MEFAQVLRRRRMIRAYDEGRPVPPEALDAVLAAALHAPSAGFTQGISFLVLSLAAEREAFWGVTGETVTGKAVTPFLLQRVSELTGGATKAANMALLVNSARHAGLIARALAALDTDGF